jgi:hypothetical protein
MDYRDERETLRARVEKLEGDRRGEQGWRRAQASPV